ncbi:Prefoldin-domain-containing protein [Paramicrosporidium saccamoebae]|uniref:Prefoldin-domain-containing protein n=1 Tax=Paramicrosporidium saccamoebae TaxID=1246581 RepID=A0A2H9TK03_9FUNG|nr:Prefoldin-domain-containing protein [Paramicrosporidium saccamoebae]
MKTSLSSPPSASQSSQLPPVEELQSRREQLEKVHHYTDALTLQELQILGESFVQLKQAQDRFVQNISTLTSLKSALPEQELMIPLTSSVYIKGVLANKDSVTVDIGTGYFVEKVAKANMPPHAIGSSICR